MVAAIVKIMKANERMSHTALFDALSSAVRFPLTEKIFRERIEYLIERDYLERDENDKNEYIYSK